MAFDIEGAKAAGYTDEEIRAYLQANPGVEKEVEKKEAESFVDTLPPPTTVIPEVSSSGQAMGTLAAGLGGQGVELVKDLAIPAAVGYGMYKTGGMMDTAKKAIGAWQNQQEIQAARNATEAAREARLAQRPGFGGTPRTGPVAPSQGPMNFEVPQARTGAMPESVPGQTSPRAPMRPVAPPAGSAPAAAPVAPQQPTTSNFMSRMVDMAKNVNRSMAPRVAQAAPAARALTGIGALLYSPELNAGEDEWAAEQRRLQGRR